MARGKKNQAETGHNSDLTDDERADLVAYFGAKIRAQRKKAEIKRAEFEAERDEVNSLFSVARGELHWTRKRFEAVLAAQDMSEAEFLAAEKERLADLRLGGLPVGDVAQLSLPLGDTADEKAAAYASGHRAGLRGDDPECPDTVAPILRPEWEHGWADGQAKLAESFARGEAFLAARNKPVVELEEDDEDETDELDPDAIDDDARKLKRAGWTLPTPEEAAFVGAEA